MKQACQWAFCSAVIARHHATKNEKKLLPISRNIFPNIFPNCLGASFFELPHDSGKFGKMFGSNFCEEKIATFPEIFFEFKKKTSGNLYRTGILDLDILKGIGHCHGRNKKKMLCIILISFLACVSSQSTSIEVISNNLVFIVNNTNRIGNWMINWYLNVFPVNREITEYVYFEITKNKNK